MTIEPRDVVVVGGGIMGSAAAYQLARRGHKVTLCEQYGLDHVFGSSHGRSRIFRLAYDIPDYVRLARRSLDAWRALESEIDRQLLWNTGGLDIGSPDSLEPIASALDSSGAPFEWVSPAEQLAGFNLPDGWTSLFQPDAGVLRARSCLEAFQDVARQNGAQILSNTRVLTIEDRPSSVAVETTSSTLQADSVVIASAGWSESLLAPMGLSVPIRVTREHVAYFRTAGQAEFIPFIWHPGYGGTEHYGLPGMKESCIKLGEHGRGREVAPGSMAEPDTSSTDKLSQFVRQRLPGLLCEPEMSETCLYASTPDDDFVIDRVGRIVLGVGFGGHGFKFAPLVGEMLADLVGGGTTDFVERFSAHRFGRVPREVSNAG